MNYIHDEAALERIRSRLRIEPGHVRRLRNCFYKKHQSPEASLGQLPESQRATFGREVTFHALKLRSRHDSRLDGASKLLFHTTSGQLLETVILRIASGRTSLCVSSQVGCAVRCRFCATGQMGIALNLTRDEILDQVIQANRQLRAEGRSIRNVVFMGMGEPLLNEAEVHQALDVLLSPQCFDLSPAHVLVSTVGIPDAMLRCAERFPNVGMALSLHSARQEQRELLIPLAHRYPLDVLREAMEHVAAIQRHPLMIEYLLLDGLNDTDQDVNELIAYLRGLRVHINLIPHNSIREAPDLIGTAAERRRWFAATLTAAGFTVTVRYSLGADIAAACGQLARLETVPSAEDSKCGEDVGQQVERF
ncbi:MAG: 23S rRNA (adenine(2503)-C(2))-methyltransferase RlmN [Gemmataceae bacterium]|nr:23S rRNA (adenine(2503)-C(2))-methyltransferase RlmN [Gemmataceae bacterium]